MAYLVIVSLALHFVSFYIMVILYQKIDRQKPLNQEKMHSEMEDLLLSYTTEMKENNERLARRINKLTTNPPLGQVNESLGKEAVKPKQKDKESERIASEPSEYTIKAERDNEEYLQYEPPLPKEDTEETTIDSFSTSRILSLYQQGFSISDIAKKMHMGAGEVELLLKFYK